MRYFLIILLLINFASKAQTLEEVNFTNSSATPLNTYTTGINNKGFICGYFTNSSGFNVGYVITSEGKKILINASNVSGFYDNYSVQGINDTCTILISAITSSGSIDLKKGYYNPNTKKYDIVDVSGNGQSGIAKPFAINNKNVYTGWYPNSTDRWLWTLNDSNASSLATWGAQRYHTGNIGNYTYYPTYALGNNDNDLISGYYIDAGVNKPFVYDALSNTWDPLPFNNNMKIQDINNQNKVVGQYKQANNVYCGFYGNYSTGSVSSFTSINSFFNSSNIQSVVNGINDSNHMVGSFLHPTANTWVGFILRPDLDEYRLPKFDYAKDTWTKMKNSASNSSTIDIYTSNYYGNFNYQTVDPFANNGFPLVNTPIQNIIGIGKNIPKSVSVSWKGYASEDVSAQLMFVIPNINYYETILKPLIFTKYFTTTYFSNTFGGYCFGFSYTSLFRKYRPDIFNQWYGLPINLDISQVTNTDTNSILAIERAYLKQFDPYWNNLLNNAPVTFWDGLYKIKNDCLTDSTHTSPRSLGYFYSSPPGGAHDILPYKIRTPKKFPFDVPTLAFDTVYVYDSNFPNDSSQNVLISAPSVYTMNNSFLSNSYNNIIRVDFAGIGIRDSGVHQFSQLKKSRSVQDSSFTFAMRNNLNFSVKNNLNETMIYDGSLFTNLCSNIKAYFPHTANLITPLYYKSDTSNIFTMNTSNYLDSDMVWLLNKPMQSMGISRKAMPLEQDNTSFGNRYMTYGNPDASTKKLNCFFIQSAETGIQGVSVFINDLEMLQNDSILTENPSDYIYKITKISNGNSMYNFTSYSFTNDTARQFSAENIPITSGTSHTINNFFEGTKTVIYVDNGNNGSYEDTLFLTQVPLGNNLDLENINTNFTIFPIPANDNLSIKCGNIPVGNYTILVANIAGKIEMKKETSSLLSNQTYDLNISGLATGYYFIFILDSRNQMIFTQKVEKK